MLRNWAALFASLVGFLVAGCAHSGPCGDYSRAPTEECLKPADARSAEAVPEKSGFLDHAYRATGTGFRFNIENRAIAVRDDGIYRRIYPGGLKSSEQTDDPNLAVIENLMKKARERDPGVPLKIIVFAHGGLVSHSSAVESAEELAPAMLADGFEPVFLIWNSDIFLTYGNRLCCVRDGVREGSPRDESNLFRQAWFSSWRAIGDITGGIGRMPENFTKQGIRYYQTAWKDNSVKYQLSHTPLSLRVAKLDNKKNVVEPGRLPETAMQLPDLSVRSVHCGYYLQLPPADGDCSLAVFPFEESDDALNPGGFDALHYVGDASTLPVKVVATSLTTAGGQAWHNMVRRTRIAFSDYNPGTDLEKLEKDSPSPLLPAAPTPEYCTRSLKEKSEQYADVYDQLIAIGATKASYGGFSQFFGLLSHAINEGCFVSSDFSKSLPPEIHLFGHSMGGFVVNETLARFTDLPITNATYMAAANSKREFEIASREYLHSPANQQAAPAAFFNLTLHPTAESRERFMGGILPLGSLLEWVDEYFEGPRTFDDRTWGKWNNVMISAGTLPPKVQSRLSVRVFPLAEETKNGCGPSLDRQASSARCHPLKHGDFDDFTFWRPEYVCDDRDRNRLCWARYTRSAEFCATLEDASRIDKCRKDAEAEIRLLTTREAPSASAQVVASPAPPAAERHPLDY